ncbi:MAG: hypothetical protein AB8E15_05870 [Bdellovibrionales bacterium]
MRILVFLLPFIISCGGLFKRQEVVQDCFPSKEYITVFKYLSTETVYKNNIPEAQKIADEVSKSCRGSAKRFIQLAQLYKKFDLGISNAIVIGKKVSRLSNEQALIYMESFKSFYLEGGFDLSARSSMNLAKKFMVEKDEVSLGRIRDDFSVMLDFCNDSKSLSLTKLQCAELSAQVISLNDRKDVSMADTFVSFYEQLLENRSLSLNALQAFDVAKQMLNTGSLNYKNYVTAYQFAVAPKGLNLKRDNAIRFAKKMASRYQEAKNLKVK